MRLCQATAGRDRPHSAHTPCSYFRAVCVHQIVDRQAALTSAVSELKAAKNLSLKRRLGEAILARGVSVHEL